MKLKGEEKTFWWHFGQIVYAKDIPTEIEDHVSVDNIDEDEYLYMLTSKVKAISYIYLKETDVTDVGVKYIGNLQKVAHLTIIKNEEITKNCLADINKLVDLKHLNLSKTNICLEDLPVLNQLQKLEELYVSSENTEIEYILEHVVRMKEILPKCVLYINYKSYE